MFIAVAAGLDGRLLDLFEMCARWEQSAGRRLAMVFQLGDLPLRHDFNRAAGSGGLPSPEIADLLHHRSVCPYPVVFLAGEKDNASLISGSRKLQLPRSRSQASQSGAIIPHLGLNFLAAGELVSIGDESDSVAVAAMSAFGPTAAGRMDGERQQSSTYKTPPRDRMPSRRSALRHLFTVPRRSVNLLLSHDAPRFTSPVESAEERKDRAAGHPGDLFLKVVDSIQPDAAIYGHASDYRAERRGATLLAGLPPCRRGDPSLNAVVLDTATCGIELLV